MKKSHLVVGTEPEFPAIFTFSLQKCTVDQKAPYACLASLRELPLVVQCFRSLPSSTQSIVHIRVDVLLSQTIDFISLGRILCVGDLKTDLLAFRNLWGGVLFDSRIPWSTLCKMVDSIADAASSTCSVLKETNLQKARRYSEWIFLIVFCLLLLGAFLLIVLSDSRTWKQFFGLSLVVLCIPIRLVEFRLLLSQKADSGKTVEVMELLWSRIGDTVAESIKSVCDRLRVSPSASHRHAVNSRSGANPLTESKLEGSSRGLELSASDSSHTPANRRMRAALSTITENQMDDVVNLLEEANRDDLGFTLVKIRGVGGPNKICAFSTYAMDQHVPLVVLSMNESILFWNDSATLSTGFSSKEVLGKDMMMFVDEDYQHAYTCMKDAAANKVTLCSRIVSIAHAKLGNMHATVTISPLTDSPSSKNVVGFVLLFTPLEAPQQGLIEDFITYFLESYSRPGSSNSTGFQLPANGKPATPEIQWSFFSAIAKSSAQWKLVVLKSFLAEALQPFITQIELSFAPNCSETAVCDSASIAKLVSSVLRIGARDSVKGKTKLAVKTDVGSAKIATMFITLTPIEPPQQSISVFSTQAKIFGGTVFYDQCTQACTITTPFLVEERMCDMSKTFSQSATALGALAASIATPKVSLVILIVDSRTVYQNQISNLLWKLGHQLRFLKNVQNAFLALKQEVSYDLVLIEGFLRDAPLLLPICEERQITVGFLSCYPSAVDDFHKYKLIEKISKASVELAQLMEEALQKKIETNKQVEELAEQHKIFSHANPGTWVRGQKLGRGAYADVFEATIPLTGAKMAVKMIRLPSRSDEAEERQKISCIANEIKLLSKLSHPNIIHYFYCERGDRTLNLFMELGTDGSLSDLLRKTPVVSDGRLRVIVRDLLKAVEYLHSQNIIHRDIKPQNILLSNGTVKLSDFGTATLGERSSDFEGTVYYMAPEVIAGQKYGPECDIWSVGCVLCECLKITRSNEPGRLGFGPPTSFPSSVSELAKNFIMLCFDPNPQQRPAASALLVHRFVTEQVEFINRSGRGKSVSSEGSSRSMSMFTVVDE